MNYEIERRLGDKADKWELHSLQTELREAKNHIHSLERRIDHLETINSNKYYVMERFFSLLIEHNSFAELQHELYGLKGNL